MNNINILSMFRNKNKQSFFAIHQLYIKTKEYDKNINVNFHIIWDKNTELNGYDQEYSDLIDNMFKDNIVSYDRQFLKSYAKKYYNVSDEKLDRFDNFYLIYRIILGHYLRRVKLLDNFIILDDDILINYDLHDIIYYTLNNISFLIAEPMNTNCDKGLFNSLSDIYDRTQFVEKYRERNAPMLGFNAGFQGIDASIFDDFLSTANFYQLLSLFDYSSTKNPDGTEFFGPRRFMLDTQEQSFFSCMNICKSKNDPVIMNPNEYFVIPNWGTHPVFGEINYNDENQGWTFALRSKIVHFIGHTMGKGKPKVFLNRVDEYLKNLTTNPI